MAFTPEQRWSPRTWLGFGLLFALYLGVRLVAWSNPPMLEDHDSVGYVQTAQAIASLDGERVAALPPDTLPLFPILAAAAGGLTGDAESGARLASLVCSAALFWILVGIGRWFTTPAAIAAGLALLTFAPFYVRMSYSLLTQPTYLATVYAGSWALLACLSKPRLATAVLAGAMFGLAFLARVEGIIYLVLGPAMLFVWQAMRREPVSSWRSALLITGALAVSFVVLAAPQIAVVSSKMGTFSINGRETWIHVLRQPDPRKYGEKIYGLDYSPTTVNIRYLQAHPEATQRLSSASEPLTYLKAALRNYAALSEHQMTALIGAPALAFAAIGLVMLCLHGAWRSALALAILSGATLALGVAYSVAERHIAVAGPLLFLMAGYGFTTTARVLGERFYSRPRGTAVAGALLLAGSLAAFIAPLYDLIREPDVVNTEYQRTDYVPFEREVTALSDREKPTVIVARKGYLPFFARTVHVPLPYTDYAHLVRYMTANSATLLFLEFNNFGVDRPAFAADLDTPAATAHFRSILRRTDAFGERLELFEFCPAGCASAGTDRPVNGS